MCTRAVALSCRDITWEVLNPANPTLAPTALGPVMKLEMLELEEQLISQLHFIDLKSQLITIKVILSNIFVGKLKCTLRAEHVSQ